MRLYINIKEQLKTVEKLYKGDNMKIYDSIQEEDKYILDAIYESSITGNYIIVGKLGLWDGIHSILPIGTFNTPYEAIQECRGSTDILRLFIEPQHKLFVECIHHDGTNRFEIRQLNKLGMQYLNEGLSIDTIIDNTPQATSNCGKIFDCICTEQEIIKSIKSDTPYQTLFENCCKTVDWEFSGYGYGNYESYFENKKHLTDGEYVSDYFCDYDYAQKFDTESSAWLYIMQEVGEYILDKIQDD